MSANAPQLNTTGSNVGSAPNAGSGSAPQHALGHFGPLALALRGARFYWRTNLAVLAGVAIAAAVVGGALIVGDSVRGSLKQMTLSRLGRVDFVIRGHRFITQELATKLGAPADGEANAPATSPWSTAPVLVLTGGLQQARDGTTRRAGNVNVYGLDAAGWELVRGPKPPASGVGQASSSAEAVPAPSGQRVVITHALGATLGVKPGDALTLWIELPSSIPRDTLLGRRDDAVLEVALEVGAVLDESAPVGRFGLTPNQQLPSNVFVDLAFLQDQLDLAEVRPSRRDPEGRPARVNAVLLSHADVAADRVDVPQAMGLVQQLMARWRDRWALADAGVRVVADTTIGALSVESEQLILDDESAAAALRLARRQHLENSPAYVYLANAMENAADKSKHSMYSTVAGLDVLALQEPPFGPFEFVGSAPTSLADHEIILNEFVAEDLNARIGDSIRMRYHEVGGHGELPEREFTWRVAGIVRMTGPAVDRGLTPQVRGITDVESLADWEAPFPMKLDEVTPRDDEYWDQYRATPKAFVLLSQARKLWQSRYGGLTSLRLAPEGGSRPSDVVYPSAEEVQTFARDLARELDPLRLGWSFEPVRLSGLKAAQGSQDFTGLFLGFSMFLIVAAGILVALVFRLGIEQRVHQWGLLGAIGFSQRQVLVQVLFEGTLLALLGATAGAGLAVAYAELIVYGLKTWWIGAIGTRFLDVYLTWPSVVGAWVTGVVVALATMGWSVWQLRRVSVLQQLVGQVAPAAKPRTANRWWTPLITGGLALLLLIAAWTGALPPSNLAPGLSTTVFVFFVAGLLLLTAGVTAFSAWLEHPLATTRSSGWLGLARLGGRNASRNRARSVLTTGLIAIAVFLVVVVAAARKDPTVERPQRDSGNGGFSLVAESTTPILFDMNTEEGRAKLNLSTERASSPEQRARWEAALQALRVVPFRVRPGDDASCLNLFQTQTPTLLGASEEMIARGGFRFADAAASPPWSALAADKSVSPEAPVPALGDLNTLMFSLKKGMGDLIPLAQRDREPRALRVAGLFDGAVFQGVLVVSERDLLRLYPDVSGYRYFLIDVPLEHAPAAEELLETCLNEYGFDSEPVAERLARFLAVQNTYLSTFQALGGMGLLLGTAGLATVMLRNVLERRSELALLRAIGFGDGQIVALVLAENALLLLWGLALGAAAALLAMSPHLQSVGADPPWLSGTLLLVSIVVVGMAAAALAVRTALRTPIVATLRGE